MKIKKHASAAWKGGLKDGKAMAMGYYEAPSDVLDDAEQARFWGQLAVDAALRAAQRAAKPKSRRPR